MIRRIKLLQHIGVFNTDTTVEPHNLKRVVLIYAENGSGKTTLAEVLRSLETNDASIILDRCRSESDDGPDVVLECDGNSLVRFQNRSWHGALPRIRVFDEIFVDKNVYSGLNVESRHRKNLHDFALGKKGVAWSQLQQEMGQQVEENNRKQKDAERRMPDGKLHGFSMDKFCDLLPIPDVEDQIILAQQKLKASQDKNAICSAHLFETFLLPQFDVEAIQRILSADLSALDKAANARVHMHIKSLGRNVEAWINDGMEYIPIGVKDVCPFCGQKITNKSLVKHYRIYFSNEYARLKHDIGNILVAIQKAHSETVRDRFKNGVKTNKTLTQFWGQFLDVSLPMVDAESILHTWISAYDTVLSSLMAKQASLLEQKSWDNDVLKTYEHSRQQIVDMNTRINTINTSIKNLQAQVSTSKTDELKIDLERLKAIRARHSRDISTLCDEYLQAKTAKADAELQKAQVGKKLETYRNNVFPALCANVNKYLTKFNAGFILDEFQSVNNRFGPSCNYNVRVNNMVVSIGKNKSQSPRSNQPTFGHTLSTGDRTTLAFALFFSSVVENENLKDCIIVVDDPVSSLDEFRYTTTAQMLRDLSKKTQQLFILSHNKQFLSQVWREVGPKKCSSLLISRRDKGSIISDWGINLETNAKQTQQQCVLEEYIENKNTDPEKVANAIRLYLEASLERTCASHYRASSPFSTFIKECRKRPGEILAEDVVTELEDIYRYANQFHHGSRLVSQSDDIVSQELEGYVRRVLAVMRPSLSDGKRK